jgi:hypothetical protein
LLSDTAKKRGETRKGENDGEDRGHTTRPLCGEESLPERVFGSSRVIVFRANPYARPNGNARGTLPERMDRTTSGPSAVSARYPAAPNGILTPEGLLQACAHVWRDSDSVVMLGADVLNSEPVSCDDKQALTALKRHIAAAGPHAFIEDVLPNLGFGPSATEHVKQVASSGEQTLMHQVNGVDVNEKLTCVKCGEEAVPLHLGCRLCEDCCDCRPLGT